MQYVKNVWIFASTAILFASYKVAAKTLTPSLEELADFMLQCISEFSSSVINS